jgi:Ni/Co efflux regulator RcnB
MYLKLIPAVAAAFVLASTAALAAPAPAAQTAKPAQHTDSKAKIHHARMVFNDDRETSALNHLEAAGYTQFKGMWRDGKNIAVDAAKNGEFQHVEVTPAGVVTPSL